MAICMGNKKIGVYLSDISGAFDKVVKPYLMAKFQRAGVGEIFLNFLGSGLDYLREKSLKHLDVLVSMLRCARHMLVAAACCNIGDRMCDVFLWVVIA